MRNYINCFENFMNLLKMKRLGFCIICKPKKNYFFWYQTLATNITKALKVYVFFCGNVSVVSFPYFIVVLILGDRTLKPKERGRQKLTNKLENL